ncbi:MAG: transporter substrate-binding domain-containing protein [Synergistaceae bacterium]|nr:transporter substrate-binding domain-containing protein [Synergistaceae bacterium]
MKKFLLVLAILLVTSSAFADDYVGFLSRLKTTPDEFFMMMKNSWSTGGWVILGGDHSSSKARFYDTLTQMQLALNSGEIDEMILPDFVADYLLKINYNYSRCCISSSGKMGLCFGFMKENAALRDKWNEALSSMLNDYSLIGLAYKYVKNIPEDESYDEIYGINRKQLNKEKRIKFEHFKDAPTVKVAVTGDLPPVDFIGEDGLPAGYSVAVLAEIGRRLHVNISIINVNAGARTAALVSGRADIVFWYEINKSLSVQPDVPDEVILSMPYLNWDKFFHVTLSDTE